LLNCEGATLAPALQEQVRNLYENLGHFALHQFRRTMNSLWNADDPSQLFLHPL